MYVIINTEYRPFPQTSLFHVDGWTWPEHGWAESITYRLYRLEHLKLEEPSPNMASYELCIVNQRNYMSVITESTQNYNEYILRTQLNGYPRKISKRQQASFSATSIRLESGTTECTNAQTSMT